MRIGIDLGGTKIEGIALDDSGALLVRRRVVGGHRARLALARDGEARRGQRLALDQPLPDRSGPALRERQVVGVAAVAVGVSGEPDRPGPRADHGRHVGQRLRRVGPDRGLVDVEQHVGRQLDLHLDVGLGGAQVAHRAGQVLHRAPDATGGAAGARRETADAALRARDRHAASVAQSCHCRLGRLFGGGRPRVVVGLPARALRPGDPQQRRRADHQSVPAAHG